MAMIGEEKSARVVAVGADAADFGGEMQDDVGAEFCVEAFGVCLVGQVEILAAGDEEVVDSRAR